jgi:hypothetical protein
VDPTGHENPAEQLPLHVDVLKPTTDALNHVPPGHAEHTAAPGRLKRPAVHMTAVGLEEPRGHAYPAVQVPLHVEVPRPTTDASNQVPPGHTVHIAEPGRLYWPTGHTNSVALTDPEGHANPAVHGPLQWDEFKPSAAPNRPAWHAVHETAPVTLY